MFVETAPSRPPEPPDVSPDTTGASAIYTLGTYTWHLAKRDDAMWDLEEMQQSSLSSRSSVAYDVAQPRQIIKAHDKRAGEQLEALISEIGGVRMRMAGLTRSQAAKLDEYCETSVPEEIKEMKGSKVDAVSWQAWMLTASPDQLMSFLQWHVGSLQEQQKSPEFEASVNRETEKLKLGISRGLRGRWLDEDAEAAIDAVDYVEVYVGDVFDTLMQDRGGYHIRGTQYVVIAAPVDLINNPTQGLEQSIRYALLHELGHAVIGEFEQTWLDEATDQHIVEAIKYGQSAVLNPAKRSSTSATYKARRSLASRLLRDLPVAYLTRAFSEIRHDNSDRTALVEGIEHEWEKELGPEGQGILNAVHKRVKTIEDFHINRGISRSRAGAIAATRVEQLLLIDPRDVLAS